LELRTEKHTKIFCHVFYKTSLILTKFVITFRAAIQLKILIAINHVIKIFNRD